MRCSDIVCSYAFELERFVATDAGGRLRDIDRDFQVGGGQRAAHMFEYTAIPLDQLALFASELRYQLPHSPSS